MNPKQDRQGVRTPTDIERKYHLGQDYDEVKQLATNAQKTATTAQSTANNAAVEAAQASATAEAAAKTVNAMDTRVTALEETDKNPGEDGATFIPSVDDEGNISWTNDKGLENPETKNIKGSTGASFTPSVDIDGNLSWTNDKGLDNPETVNIKGPKGEPGGESVTVDSELSATSENPVQNQVIYEALSGKAPGGYGLGAARGTLVTDCDDAIINGWYHCGSGVANRPSFCSAYAVLFVIGRVVSGGTTVGYSKQIYMDHLGIIGIRNGDGADAWDEWECLNPPMVSGVEYRTVERFQNLPVYIMEISMGTGPGANATKTVNHNISNMKHIVDCRVCLNTANNDQVLALPYYNSSTNYGNFNVNYQNVRIIAGATALTGYTKCYAWIKYTKTTD